MSDPQRTVGNDNNAADVIVRGSAAGFAQEIFVGLHRLSADEPRAAGGADTGPSPYDSRTNSNRKSIRSSFCLALFGFRCVWRDTDDEPSSSSLQPTS